MHSLFNLLAIVCDPEGIGIRTSHHISDYIANFKADHHLNRISCTIQVYLAFCSANTTRYFGFDETDLAGSRETLGATGLGPWSTVYCRGGFHRTRWPDTASQLLT